MRRSTLHRIASVRTASELQPGASVWYLHDISTHQSVARELIECTSLHRDRGEVDGRTAVAAISHHLLARSCPASHQTPSLDPVPPRLLCVCPSGLEGGPRGGWQTEMAGILAWFWNERFWLPHNVTWADLKNTDESTFPQAEDLYLACPLAFCIFMIRLVFER